VEGGTGAALSWQVAIAGTLGLVHAVVYAATLILKVAVDIHREICTCQADTSKNEHNVGIYHNSCSAAQHTYATPNQETDGNQLNDELEESTLDDLSVNGV
jgi:hypothetical protein